MSTDDDLGYLLVMHAGNAAGEKGDEWHREFRAWYKPERWLGSHRAAAVFLGNKVAQAELAARTNAETIKGMVTVRICPRCAMELNGAGTHTC